MDGGLESCCMGRVYGAGGAGAVRLILSSCGVVG
jgi:hypothetical protein